MCPDQKLTKVDPTLDDCAREVQSLIEGSADKDETLTKHIQILTCMEKYEVINKLAAFDKDQTASFKFIRSFMNAVMSLLPFIRATRLGCGIST